MNNNGRQFSVEVLSVDTQAEIKIRVKSKNGTREKYTDGLELASWLRFADSYEKSKGTKYLKIVESCFKKILK